MSTWPLASGLFFGYAAGVAAIHLLTAGARAPRQARFATLALRGSLGSARAAAPFPAPVTALLLAALGLALSDLSIRLPFTPLLHDWLLPPALLLIAYWTSGLLFVAPMPRVERLLIAADGMLRIRAIAARAPRVAAEVLEAAYVGVYPLVPLALVIQVTLTPAPEPQRFWTIVLITDYICFGLLPWVQTRTPRSLETGEPWRSRVRQFNLRLMGAASIQVNTFPSGHAAEALVAALLVLDAPAPWVAWMCFNAAAVSAGAVFGRYHYALDAIAGWIVGLVVWFLLRG